MSRFSPTRRRPIRSVMSPTTDEARENQTLGSDQGRHPWGITMHPRPGPYHRRKGIPRVAATIRLLSSVQFQRMATLVSSGQDQAKRCRHDQGCRKSSYHHRDGSFSIDQQRYYNAQVRRPIISMKSRQPDRRHDRGRRYSNPDARILECLFAVCDESDYRFGGSFFDARVPGQVSAVSHGSARRVFDGTMSSHRPRWVNRRTSAQN